MKISEALAIINTPSCSETGYMVHMEKVERNILTTDHFPDKHSGEHLIETEEEAWDLAYEFAAKTINRYVNIYVVNADFIPVKDYKKRRIGNRT